VKIAVTGASGQLGAALVHQFSARHDVVGFTHATLDIADAVKVNAEMSRLRPQLIINAAAFTAVDLAEDRPVEALQANAFAVRSLARAAADQGAALVHYSTDFVFDGTASAPYTEDDRPNPRSTYAASKLLGEWFASDAPRAFVLRVESLFGRAPGVASAKGTVEGILNGLKSGSVVRAIEDRTVSPSSVLDVARATMALIERGAPAGIYHCVNSGFCTWLELAREGARLLGIEPRIEPVRHADFKLKAARPQYCALSNAKLTALGIEMPRWDEALRGYISEIGELVN
jgi:dTDP-4-dehydrorhamnose reductase